MAAKRPPNETIVLPSGVQVDFYDEVGVDGKPQQRRYLYNGEKFVSISTVSNVYEKPTLVWWAGKVTVEGMIELARFWPKPLANMTVDEACRVLADQGLDWQSVRDHASARGDVAHKAFLALLSDGKVPVQGDYHPKHWPYIRAGVRWVVDHAPEVIDMETIVASVTHRVAGRYDLHARFPDGRTGRIDFKTVTEWRYGKPRVDGPRDLLPPYPEHLSQLEGYELCAIESGYEPSNFRAVVRLGPDGEYDMTESWATTEHFLGDVASYRNRQALNAARPRKRRAKREGVAA